jgi:hypothetical protein
VCGGLYARTRTIFFLGGSNACTRVCTGAFKSRKMGGALEIARCTQNTLTRARARAHTHTHTHTHTKHTQNTHTQNTHTHTHTQNTHTHLIVTPLGLEWTWTKRIKVKVKRFKYYDKMRPSATTLSPTHV